MSTEKKHVYVDKALAEKIEHLQSDKQIEATVLEYFNESKRDLKYSLEGLDDDVIQYKALMMKARQSFREAKDEQLQANYDLWEKFDADTKGVSAYVSTIIAQLQPLKQELNEVNRLMQQVHRYDLERLLEIVQRLNGAFQGETGNMLKFLLNNYGKDSSQ